MIKIKLNRKIVTLFIVINSLSAVAQTIRVGALEYGKTRRPESEAKIDFLIDAINHVCESQRQLGTPLDLLVTSELPTLVGHEDGIMAEEIPGLRSQRLSECARENYVWLAVGLFERVMEAGEVVKYNTTVFFDRNGDIRSKYLKTNLPPDESGRLGISPGTIPLVLDTEFGKIGSLICWEIHTTTNVDVLAEKGAWMIVHPSWVSFESDAVAWSQKHNLYWVMSCWDGPSELFAPDGASLSEMETSTTDPAHTLVAAATIPLPDGIQIPTYFSVSGTITSNDSAIVGTSVHLSGPNCILTTYTNQDGNYLFNAPVGEYDITPGSTLFEFENNSRNVAVFDQDINEIDFNGVKDVSVLHSFSGRIIADSVGTSDVVLSLFGDQVQTTITGLDGIFEFDDIYNGTQFIVTPYKQGFTFEPEFISINDLQSNSENNVFQINSAPVKVDKRNMDTRQYCMLDNYPNPFNSSTTIHFTLAEFSQDVILDIYNLLGQKVNSYSWQNIPAGSYSQVWDGLDFKKRIVGAGVYYYVLKGSDIHAVKKMTLLP